MSLFPKFATKQEPFRLLACPHCARFLDMREHGYHCPGCGRDYTHSGLMRAYSTCAEENYQTKVNKRFQEMQVDTWKKLYDAEHLEKARLENERVNFADDLDSLRARVKNLEDFCQSLTEDREYA